MSDLISRQAAMDAVEFGITYAKAFNKSTGEVKELFKEGNKALNEAVERLKELPSAQPERKIGKWIKATGMMPPEFHGRYCCSECGNFANMEPPFGNREDLSKFCPNCGADMRGEQDDSLSD